MPRSLILTPKKSFLQPFPQDVRQCTPVMGFYRKIPCLQESVKSAGLVFIGPPADAITTMGDKIASRELAVKAGVPVIPGHNDALKDNEEALMVADDIGYPVLLKPAAGGGGKGMRIVRSSDEMEQALSAVVRKPGKHSATHGFSWNVTLKTPPHRVSILADMHGNVIHLGERECSIQRRYQKIIEESPSPAI
jgi:propionyl-CoA carboxylase alpha chain